MKAIKFNSNLINTFLLTVLLIVDYLFFTNIQPNSNDQSVILVAYLFIGLTVLLLINLIFNLVIILNLIKRKINSLIFSTYITLFIVIILAMNSVGQLSMDSLFLLFLFFILFYWYIRELIRKKKTN